jgi:hypothetical protein
VRGAQEDVVKVLNPRGAQGDDAAHRQNHVGARNRNVARLWENVSRQLNIEQLRLYLGIWNTTETSC